MIEVECRDCRKGTEYKMVLHRFTPWGEVTETVFVHPSTPCDTMSDVTAVSGD